MDKQAISFVMGKRLKELREERGLSHDKLIKQLNERYGVSVSRDSVMAYEISDEKRSKASKLPNMGMRAETLYCLADFYGVSLDYLLGKTDIKSFDTDLKSVCEYTGLSEQAVENIWSFCHTSCDVGIFSAARFISGILESPDLYKSMTFTFDAINATASKRYNALDIVKKKDKNTQEEQSFLCESEEFISETSKMLEKYGRMVVSAEQAEEYSLMKAKEYMSKVMISIFENIEHDLRKLFEVKLEEI